MRRKSGCGTWLGAIGLVGAVAFGLSAIGNRIDRMRFPWGYADSGSPPLVGTWVGPVTTGSGKRLAMLLDMQLAPLDYHRRRGAPIVRTRRSTWLIGRTLVCGSPGRVAHFTIYGKPDDGTASRFQLSLSTADSIPVDGLAPSHLRGQWNGGDALTLEASLYLRRGKGAITSSDDPDTGRDTPVTMKRGTEADFTALCRRL